MGWDGAGGYTRQHNFSADASAGIKILAARMDQEIDDIASAIPISWARNGQNTPTVDMPMGGRKFVNVGAPTSVSNFMRVREFIENVPIFMQDAESSADRISVSSQYFTSVSANQAPVDGAKIMVRVNSHKSSAALYLDGHSANVEYQDGNRIAGALVSGGIYEFVYSSVDGAWKIPRPDDGRTAAEVAAGVTPVNFQIPPEPVDPARYYSGDLAAAINSAITVCQQLTAPHFRMTMSGSVGSNSITFDLPDNSTIELLGEITSTVTSNPCLRIGSTTAQRFGYWVSINQVSRTTVDTSNGSTGIQLRNLAASTIFIREVLNFQTGVFCFGSAASAIGFTYCHVHLGLIHDNKTNLVLEAASSGYCNENNFYGGSLNHSSTYNGSVFTDTIGLDIRDFATPLNNNRFYGLSIESNAGAGVGIAAFIAGQHNILFAPRLENPNDAAFEIEFHANSSNCGIIGRGFGVGLANIDDNGTSNYYDTDDGSVAIAGTTAAAGQSVHVAQSSNTSTAKCYTARDSSGTDTAWFKGTGEAEFLFPTATTAALEAIGNAINTSGKRDGKVVRNTTSNKLVIAQGAAAASTWISVDGATTHTPI